VAGFASAGWTELTNRRTRLTVGGVDLELVGVDDPHLDYDRYAAVAGPAAADAALTIGVTHAPYQRVLDAMTADGAGLVIAGHTHGGQLCVPGWGALVTNCDLDTRRAKGVSRWWPGAGGAPSSSAPEGAAYLEVSAGLGTSPMAPVRFACRPEASLLTLVPRDA
jgi:predicted MPP superfamily phosphohydrolase